MPKTTKKKHSMVPDGLQKCPTGIKGFDEITEGGLPRNRTTLFCGTTGTGKTLLGIDFIINGAVHYNEPGLFMSFEETADELYKDVASLNWDLKRLVSQKKILLEYVFLERRDIQENDFNLEGLLIRLEHAIDSIGAKRVVLDSIESIFAGLKDSGVLRVEIKRLFGWLKEKNVTTIVMPALAITLERHQKKRCVLAAARRITAFTTKDGFALATLIAERTRSAWILSIGAWPAGSAAA